MIAHRATHIVPRRVLIVKPSALGDVVTAMPVLRALKRTFPAVQTSWLLSDACAPLVAHDSQLDEVVPFERKRLGRAWRSRSAAAGLYQLMKTLRRGDYDWVIDLQGLLRSGFFAAVTGAPLRVGFADAREFAWAFYDRPVSVTAMHTVDRNIALAQEIGLDARGEDMSLEVAATAKDFTDAFCLEAGLDSRGYLVCVPPTRWQSKQYPVRHWRRVVRQLGQRLPVLVLGGPSDEALCAEIVDGVDSGVISLAGRTTVPEMVGLIADSAGVVCCDSAAKFIAPAVGVNVVTLIGPTQLERTGPYRLGSAVVAGVHCQGCLKRTCHPAVCMEVIDPDEVVSAVGTMLNPSEQPHAG